MAMKRNGNGVGQDLNRSESHRRAFCGVARPRMPMMMTYASTVRRNSTLLLVRDIYERVGIIGPYLCNGWRQWLGQ